LGFDDFVFLSLGAMTVNKGIEPLLKAFAVVAQKHRRVRLVMKGLGALYHSREFLDQQSSQLSQAERALVQPRLRYSQDTLSFMDLAKLYQSADAYVSPYSAEGFNMPVLEAIACGLPVVCTAGGPTDDFCTDDFALRINSKRVPKKLTAAVTGTIMQIDFDHLVHQMLTAVESNEFGTNARQAGPAFVGSRFTWQHVKRQLLGILFP
jgi:glycosyltransferase involved in cell wall biosynthesis